MVHFILKQNIYLSKIADKIQIKNLKFNCGIFLEQ